MADDGFDVQRYAGYVAEWTERGIHLPLSTYGYLFVPAERPYLARDRYAEALLVAIDRELVTATLVSAPPKDEKLWPCKRRGVGSIPIARLEREAVAVRLGDGSAWDSASEQWIFVEATKKGIAYAREVRKPVPFMNELEHGGVVYPWVRRELRSGLEILVDPVRSNEQEFFSDAINDLPNSALASIGWYLRSEEEEAAMSELIDAVETVVHWSHEVGVKNNDWDWTAPDYPKVAEASARLLRLIEDADTRPPEPSVQELIDAFNLVIDGKREAAQASSWAGNWIVWGRGAESDAAWQALEFLRNHHVGRDRTTPDVIEEFRQGLNAFLRSARGDSS